MFVCRPCSVLPEREWRNNVLCKLLEWKTPKSLPYLPNIMHKTILYPLSSSSSPYRFGTYSAGRHIRQSLIRFFGNCSKVFGRFRGNTIISFNFNTLFVWPVTSHGIPYKLYIQSTSVTKMLVKFVVVYYVFFFISLFPWTHFTCHSRLIKSSSLRTRTFIYYMEMTLCLLYHAHKTHMHASFLFSYLSYRRQMYALIK